MCSSTATASGSWDQEPDAGSYDVAPVEKLRDRDHVGGVDPGEPLLGAGVGDEDRGRLPSDDGAEAIVGEPVVHGDERCSRPGRAEQGDGERRRALGGIDDPLRTRRADHRRGTAGEVEQSAGGEPVCLATDREAVAVGSRGHLEQQRDVHALTTPHNSS